MCPLDPFRLATDPALGRARFALVVAGLVMVIALATDAAGRQRHAEQAARLSTPRATGVPHSLPKSQVTTPYTRPR